MKTLGIVTLYYPPKHLVENLLSYIDELDGLLIWDNTPQPHLLYLPEKIEKKVIRIRKGENVGIGAALNDAAIYAIQNHYTHLLTMDQDSAFLPTTFYEYLQAIRQDKDFTYAAYVPLINSAQTNTSGPKFKEAQGMIVSGSIFPVETLKNIGLFNSKLIMDAIDTEYALRIWRKKGKIAQVQVAKLKHELGHPLCKRFLFWHPVSLNYPPIRTYYIARNFLYVNKMFPEFKRPDLIWKLVWERPFYILFLEQNKWSKLKALIQGVLHGMKGNLNHDAYFQVMNTKKK